MQIDRLFQIVQILLNKEKVTARELSQRFGVSTRTIYRDIDTLSVNGVPVYTTKGKGGGIGLMDNYTMDQSVLSDEEKNQLLLGLETLRATQAGDVLQVLDKFRDMFKPNHTNWIRVDFSHWGNDPKERQKFEDIKLALTSYHIVVFNYYDAYGSYSRRQVCPVQLVFKEKAWYLSAYCMDKKAFRFFKLMRIADLSITLEKFNPQDYPLDEEMFTSKLPGGSEQFKFWISSKARYRMYDDFYKENIKVLSDGNFVATYDGHEDEWLYGFILSYGENLKVIEPESLRRTIRSRIHKMVDNYL